MKWHIIAYRKYKDDCLRFNKRLRKLEGEGTRLIKDTIEEIRTLKWYIKEVIAHMEDARRDIDINRRACRSSGVETPDEDEISEQDIDTNVALGDASASDDTPSPPRKKRKSDRNFDDYDSDDRPPQPSRPAPKKKVRPEEQKAKNAFKARVLQDQSEKTGIKLKIPRKSLSPEITKHKQVPAKGVARIKSPEKKKPKSDDSRTLKRPEKSQQSRPQEFRPHSNKESKPLETRPPGPRAVPPRIDLEQVREKAPRPIQEPAPAPAPQPASKPNDNRPKPRRKSVHASESPTKETAPRRESVSSQPERDISPTAPREGPTRAGPSAPPLSDPAPTPLFLDPPEVSRRLPQRNDQWLASDSPVPKVANSVPPSGRTADEAVEIDDFPSPGAVSVPLPLPVKSEPLSPGGYSGSEGEVEHDLGLDAELGEPAPIM